MTSEGRESVGVVAALLDDPIEIARREAAHAVQQFDTVLDLIDEVARGGRSFRLRPSTILLLHKTALDGLSPYAGTWRPSAVSISQSQHAPPDASRLPSLIEEMCDWINDRRDQHSALELCAYVMWRLNWIHPFNDGNGRTSRAVSYLVLCARSGDRIPGRLAIPEQIALDRLPCYAALEAADRSCLEDGGFDLSEMEAPLHRCLAAQLASTLTQAAQADRGDEAERKLH